jgi:hypothetical protein
MALAGRKFGGTQVEICEIVCIKAGFLGNRNYFVARAAGSKGVYEAARSTTPFEAYEAFRVSQGGATGAIPFTDSKLRRSWEKAHAALDEIMTKLSSDGWQLDGKSGPEWWEYKYRR